MTSWMTPAVSSWSSPTGASKR